jgi:tryptophan-rich sensory protein
MTIAASATGIAFYKIDKTAGLLLLPYVAWLSFATILNYSLYKLNPPAIEDKKSEVKKSK